MSDVAAELAAYVAGHRAGLLRGRYQAVELLSCLGMAQRDRDDLLDELADIGFEAASVEEATS